MRRTFSELWDRYEQIAGYVVIAIVAVIEILATVSSTIDDDFPESGRIALLATGLLLFFRSIDRNIASIRAPIFKTEFTEGFHKVLREATRPCALKIMANDGFRYYSVLSEAQIHVKIVELIVADQEQCYRWWRLVQRGVIGSLEIRLNDGQPVMHCCIANDELCLIGSLVPRVGGGLSAAKHVLIKSDTPGSRELIESLGTNFTNLWPQLASLDQKLD